MKFNYYKNKNILVTGASGYIGSGLVKKLKEVPCKITALNSETDIRDKKFWTNSLKRVDIIFHLAAQTSSRLSNQKPLLDAQINLLPIIKLVETCQRYSYRPDIIFAGTVTEVGLTKTIPVDEAFQDEPITIYDINKLAAEKYLQYYSRQLGGRAVTLRLSNVYGPGPGTSQLDRGILNRFIYQALRGKPLTIYNKGDYLRDYIFIDDVVEAFLTAGEKIEKVNGKYWIVGSEKGYTIKQMAKIISEQIKKISDKEIKLIFVPSPKNLSLIEFRKFVANSSAFSKVSGWQAKVSLKAGIKKTIAFFRERV